VERKWIWERPEVGHDPRVSHAGAGGILFDVAGESFEMAKQHRLWALAESLAAQPIPGLRETVLGINNLLLVVDPFITHPRQVTEQLLRRWENVEPVVRHTRDVEIAVQYGGEGGEDLSGIAAHAGMSADEVIKLHSTAVYTVACLGSMAGFPYLVGLPSELHVPRRKVPRLNLREGSVIIAGSQASVLPCAGPCGWHVLGWARVSLFDPEAAVPCLLAPGDRVHFRSRSSDR
jgi:KipI family sensor histidine kinase inhibitor